MWERKIPSLSFFTLNKKKGTKKGGKWRKEVSIEVREQKYFRELLPGRCAIRVKCFFLPLWAKGTTTNDERRLSRKAFFVFDITNGDIERKRFLTCAPWVGYMHVWNWVTGWNIRLYMCIRLHTYTFIFIVHYSKAGRKAESERETSDQCVSRFRAEKTKKPTYKFSTLPFCHLSFPSSFSVSFFFFFFFVFYFSPFFLSFYSHFSYITVHLLRTPFEIKWKEIAINLVSISLSGKIQKSSNREIDHIRALFNIYI